MYIQYIQFMYRLETTFVKYFINTYTYIYTYVYAILILCTYYIRFIDACTVYTVQVHTQAIAYTIGTKIIINKYTQYMLQVIN